MFLLNSVVFLCFVCFDIFDKGSTYGNKMHFLKGFHFLKTNKGFLEAKPSTSSNNRASKPLLSGGFSWGCCSF